MGSLDAAERMAVIFLQVKGMFLNYMSTFSGAQSTNNQVY